MNQAVCILIESNNQVLAVSRKNNTALFGLPGGKCEFNELLESAAIRELFEETGLTLTNPAPCFTCMPDPNDSYICTTFRGEISGEISTNESGIVKWISWQELFDGPFGAYNLKLYQHIYGKKFTLK